VDSAAPDTLLAGIPSFGKTTVAIETSFDARETTALFLNGANPKSRDEYESAGRNAVRLLVRPDSVDAFRLRGVVDDGLWAQMRSQGQPGFGPLFPGLLPSQVAVIAADYSVIVWWAGAMTSCAESVAAMQAINPDPESAAFQHARADLAKKLRDIASDTRDEFGQPWGLVAMDQVSGSRAAAKAQISGARFALARTRQEAPAAATG
jgi:hypothetical protein